VVSCNDDIVLMGKHADPSQGHGRAWESSDREPHWARSQWMVMGVRDADDADFARV